MAQILICRNCGARIHADLASNEQELANVGMLERHCAPCGRDTTWGLAQDYRKVERRRGERRAVERRRMAAAAPHGSDRREVRDRRIGDMRRGQRRKR